MELLPTVADSREQAVGRAVRSAQGLSSCWFTDSRHAEVSFLTSRLNLRFNLYFCSDLVFLVLLAKWLALMLGLARRSQEMKCCPSQTSPVVPFSKGIFE